MPNCYVIKVRHYTPTQGFNIKEKRLKEASLKLFVIKLRKLASLIGATIVLAVAITWVFTGPRQASGSSCS